MDVIHSRPALYNEHLPRHNTNVCPCFPAFPAVRFLRLSAVSILLRSSIVITFAATEVSPAQIGKPPDSEPSTLMQPGLCSASATSAVACGPSGLCIFQWGLQFLLHQRCGELPHNSVWKDSAAAAQNRGVSTCACLNLARVVIIATLCKLLLFTGRFGFRST